MTTTDAGERFGLVDFKAEMRRLRNAPEGPLQMPPPIDPVEWIEENVSLSRGVSALRPGKLRLVEWQKEPFRAMCGALPGIREVVGMKCTQVGWSLLAILAAIYLTCVKAAKVTIAQPAQDRAQQFAEEDMDPILVRCRAFRAITRPRVKGETQDKWWLRLLLNGGVLRLVGAAANNAFRSYKSLAMFLDEIDDENYQDHSTSGEGDKIGLARQRTQTFWNSVVGLFSTPGTRQRSLVWREWEASDKRRFFVPCPHCGHRQWLKFGGPETPYGLKFDRDEDGRVRAARYLCESPECGAFIEEEHKRDMIASGEWRPTALPVREGLAGYHVSRLLSIAPKAKWKTIGEEWFEAQGDPEKLQVFVTLTLGEPWDEVEVNNGARQGLAMRAEAYEAEVPEGVKHLLLAVDVNAEGSEAKGKNPGLECLVLGVGEGEEAWVVGYAVLDRHAPWSPGSIEELDALRRREWTRADGTKLKIVATVIDRGSMPTEVMDYCRARWRENVWAIKGANLKKGRRAPSIAGGKPSKNRRTGHTWMMVDTQGAKDLVNRRLAIETPGPRYIHFHDKLPDRFFQGLAAETLVKLKDGSYFWDHRSSIPNEPWDLLVYGFIALELAKNASERLVADLRISSRGTEAPSRTRYVGPSRAWSPEGGAEGLVRDLQAVAGAVAEAAGKRGRPAPEVAPAAPPAPAPAPPPPDDDEDDVRPFWQRRGAALPDETPSPRGKGGPKAGGFSVGSSFLRGRLRR